MKYIFNFILFSLPFVAKAQPDFSHLYNYGVNNGLSQNSVYVIKQDKEGFIWIGTGDGLNKFDGRTFKIFRTNTNDTSLFSLQGTIINSMIVEDSEGKLWFNTNKGLVYINKKTERFYRITKNAADQSMLSVGFIPVGIGINDSLWGYIPGYGVAGVNTHNHDFILYKIPISANLKPSEIVFLDNKIYMIRNEGLICYDTRLHKVSLLMTQKGLNAICSLSENQLLLGCNNQLLIFNLTNRSSTSFPPSAYNSGVKSWRQLAGGNLDYAVGVTNNNTIYLIKWKDLLITPANLSENSITSKLIDYSITSTFIDRSQNLWIGTDGAGLFTIDLKPHKFNRYPSSTTSNENLMVKGIYMDPKKNILIGTFNKGMYVYNTLTGRSVQKSLTPNTSKNHDPIFFFYEDSSGRIWANSNNKVGILNDDYNGFQSYTSLKEFPEPNGPPIQIYSLLEYRKNKYFLGTNYGYYEFGLSSGNRIVNEPRQILVSHSGGFVYSMKKRTDGTLYIGKVRGGFWIIKEVNNDWTVIDSGFLNTSIRDFYFCTNHELTWIACDEGLIAYSPKNKTHRIFNESDGMSNQYVYGILAENDSSFWFSTNKGINHAIVKYGKDNTVEKISFTSFTFSDGLQSNEFNSGAFYKSKTGEMIFGGVAGINWFYPDSIINNPFRGIPAITKMYCNDKLFTNTDTGKSKNAISLSYQQNTLAFEFASLEFTKPEANKFSYRMKGVESDWSVPSTTNFVKYANLPPGNYTFQLRSSNNDGQWSEKPLELKIIIAPPFWATWWFRITALLLLLFGIITSTKKISQTRLKRKIEKLEQQQALNLERERIAREMHDDIGAGLTQITLMSEHLKRQTEKSNQSKAEEIAGISRKLISSIGEIIWSLNPETHQFTQFSAYLREQIHRLLEFSSISYDIQFPERDPAKKLTAAQKRNILMISKEIIRNCIRHSNASQLSFQMQIKNQQIHYKIADNGRGFDPEAAFPGNGLKNIKKRALELKGEIKITSVPDKGSCFLLTLPLLNTT